MRLRLARERRLAVVSFASVLFIVLVNSSHEILASGSSCQRQ